MIISHDMLLLVDGVSNCWYGELRIFRLYAGEGVCFVGN